LATVVLVTGLTLAVGLATIFSSGLALRLGMVLFCFETGAVGMALLVVFTAGLPTADWVLDTDGADVFAVVLAGTFAVFLARALGALLTVVLTGAETLGATLVTGFALVLVAATLTAGFDAGVALAFATVLTAVLVVVLTLALAGTLAVTLGAGFAAVAFVMLVFATGLFVVFVDVLL
jgi:hypothetical protein